MQQQPFAELFETTNDNADKLLEVVNEFPYFSIAHYYLLKRTDHRVEDYGRIAGRTALHFNNVFYLNYLLNKKDNKRKVLLDEPIFPVITDAETPTLLSENPETAAITPNNEAEALVFEPLYTSDYFASQGIKLGEEIKPDDKLGKQLKSFTDWLKTMKKVHDGKPGPLNEQVDLFVQNIAEKSNTEEIIVTESMAEVFVTQGKISKAHDIYQKLSLLNPSKSAYFAAKLESLNEK